MAVNRIDTTQYLTDQTLVRFINVLSHAKLAWRDLENFFKDQEYATGATINYRKEEQYLAGEGATATDEARVTRIAPLTIDKQFHIMLSYTGKELTFDRVRDQPYLDEALYPRAKALANRVEKFIAQEKLCKSVAYHVGTPGVALDYTTILRQRALANDLAIPDDGRRYVGLPNQLGPTLTGALAQYFNRDVTNSALIDGFVGRLAGSDWFETSFYTRQIAGAGQTGASGVPGYKLGGTVKSDVTGGTIIPVENLDPNELAFRKGDKLMVSPSDGVFLVNPLTKDPIEAYNTGAQFCVAEDTYSDSSGEALVKVVQEIISSGARANISGPIPATAQLLLAQDHNQVLLFHRQAIVFAAPRMVPLRGGAEARSAYSDLYKMSLTYTLGADVTNYLQKDRMDIICGCAINPEFVVAAIS